MPETRLFLSGIPRARQIAIWISVSLALFLSLLDLAGWIFNISLFKSLIPHLGSMNLMTAFCFIITASALVIILIDSPLIIMKLLPIVLATVICCINLVSVYALLYSFETGHELSLTADSSLSFFLSPEKRITLLTSFNFLLTGAMLLLLLAKEDKLSGIAHFLMIPVFFISYYTIVKYILDVNSVIGLSNISIPLNTDIAFFSLCTSVFLMRPQTWLLKTFTSRNTGGIFARKLIPALIILPLVIGWLHKEGDRASLFKSEEDVILLAIIYTICFLVLVWMTARSVNIIDIQRQASEEALRERESQLRELNATKDKFFNIIAHDLKNPFTSLLGSSELLYENIGSLETENIRELALILNDSAKSGYAILQNLLDWSRSQTGLLKINPERVNLRNLINENISSQQLAAANKDIKMYYKAEDDIFVYSDKNMINTILRNLLSNAVKFTYKSGRVAVTTTRTNDEVVVSVKDSGIGISEEKIKELFKLDTRNSNPGTENEQGTGLGLKLSKEFVEKLGGRIWVECIETTGSEFMFSIPIKED
ncbi:MAG: HAMP domain-containing sensor histidine kinase [Bacteroidales bacterium]